MASVTTTVDEATSQEDKTAAPDPREARNRKIEKIFIGKLDRSESVNKQHRPEWKRNVELRMGRTTTADITGGVGSVEDDLQSEINPDWSLTKTKVANLYSQTPQVILEHHNDQYGAAIPPFAKALNYELGEQRANVCVPMEECLNDIVNASGIGGYFVYYAARFDEPMEVPVQDVTGEDPEVIKQAVALKLIPTKTITPVVSDKFGWSRIAPTDLRWPSEFMGSNFDDADWIGRKGRCSKADAQHEFKLDEAQLRQLSDNLNRDDTLRSDEDGTDVLDTRGISFDDAYYWRHRYDPDEKHFKAIWRIVYVDGLDDPVIHEPWKGQKYDEQTGSYVGSCKFPIRIGTLTYISDNPIPPSDSQAGRPQVNDMRRSRNQMFMQRDRSRPVRWYDVNRFDAITGQALRQGDWQGFIPTNGPGDRAMGELARATYPGENLQFDIKTQNDLRDVWNLGQNQMGNYSSGESSATEAQQVQAGFNTNIGKERDRVAKFFLGGVEVLAGLMALYSDFKVLSEQERAQMQNAWNTKQILHDLVFKILPDSTVRLDPQAEINRLMQGLNMTAKSGFVNAEPIIARIWTLLGVDPATVMIKPQPPKPESNVSFRFSGKDDIINPAVAAILAKEGQLPGPQDLEAAKQFLTSAQQAPMPPQIQPTPPMGMGGPGGPPPSGLPGPGGPPPPMGPPPGGALPMPNPVDWTLPDRIAKRTRDIGGE